MSVAIENIIPAVQIAGSATVYFTATAPTRIDQLTVANTDASAGYNVTLYLVPSGGTAGTTNLITALRRLQPNESWSVAQIIGHVLNAGDMIAALCSTAAKVNLFASGTVLTS